jgi:quercetin dioxygenase-like cupin family protein
MPDADPPAASAEPENSKAPPVPEIQAVRWLGEPSEIPTRPGMFRRSFIGPDDGVRELFLEELTFHQGAAIPLHLHPVVEVFVVLAGSLTFRLGAETIVVGPEHTVTVPPNTPQSTWKGGSPGRSRPPPGTTRRSSAKSQPTSKAHRVIELAVRPLRAPGPAVTRETVRTARRRLHRAGAGDRSVGAAHATGMPAP